MKENKLQMKSIYLILAILFSVSIDYGQAVKPKVLLTSEIAGFNHRGLKLKFTLENNSNENVYIATDPVQVSGQKGYYLLIDKIDRSLVKISSRVYPSPPYFPIIDARSVLLKKLSPGEKYGGTIFIKFPAKETDPPYYGERATKGKIISKMINRIELTIGYFVEEEGILDFLKRKPFGWYVKGQETLYSGKNKGKSFLEIQNLVSLEMLLQSNKQLPLPKKIK